MVPPRIVSAQLAESYSQRRFVESEKSCRDRDHEEKWTICWLQNRNNFEKLAAWDSKRFLSPDFVPRVMDLSTNAEDPYGRIYGFPKRLVDLHLFIIFSSSSLFYRDIWYGFNSSCLALKGIALGGVFRFLLPRILFVRLGETSLYFRSSKRFLDRKFLELW
ncbi:hypothetical protein AVEN_205804-1 [Araneus ventricosus]|uniref:Uncharacterized protein n=1 Tax=Araneus ventricosus TaxID=182803 RepID=A0A4Y2JVH3_ARAVE|nr:hypothetical protein AVEN_205804-1 [Araneus ventricosus]